MKWLCLGLLFLLISATNGQTVVTLNDAAGVPVERIGLNLAGKNYYDAGLIRKNLIERNPGFEGKRYGQVIQVAATGTSTTFRGTNIYDQVPSNEFAAGTFTVVSGANAGCAGAISANTAADQRSNGPTYTVSACPNAFAKEDEVEIAKEVYPTPASELISGNDYFGWWISSSGAVIRGDGAASDQPPGTAGKQVIAVDTTASGASATLSQYISSSRSAAVFYLFKGTYTWSFKVKLVSGTGALGVNNSRSGGFGASGSCKPTTAWSTCTGTFTANESATANGVFQFSISIPQGMSVLIDDASLTSNSDINPTSYRDEVVALETSYHPGGCRYWGDQHAETIDNWLQPPFGAERVADTQGGNYNEVAGDIQEPLPDWLFLAKRIGCSHVEIVLPITTTPTDAPKYIEYFHGSTTTPYGAKRAAEGQSAPWDSVFPIYLEIGNEPWNGASPGANVMTVNGTTDWPYIPFAFSIGTALRKSSSWPGSNIRVLAGVQSDFWASLLLASDHAVIDGVARNGYTQQGVTNATGTNLWISKYAEAYQNVNDNASMCGNKQIADVMKSGPHPGYDYVYEYGDNGVAGGCGSNGTSSTLTQAQANGDAEGEGQGIMNSLQPLLGMQAYPGVLVGWNMFTAFTSYRTGIAGDPSGNVGMGEWSSVVDVGGTYDQVRPTWQANAVVNAAILGTLCPAVLSNVPTINFAGFNNVNANATLPLIYAFPFKAGTSRSVILYNTDTSAAHSVVFAGTNPPSGIVGQVLFTSANLTDNNETGPVVQPKTATLSAFNPQNAYSVPAHSMAVLTWTTVPGAPIGLTGTVQ